MNSDLSIHRMAFRETESLGVAVALVAKKRQEMELRLLRERVLKGEAGNGARLDSALDHMDRQSREAIRSSGQTDSGIGTVVDRIA